MTKLAADGWTLFRTNLPPNAMASLRNSAFRPEGAGQRCLLDNPEVLDAAKVLKTKLVRAGFLNEDEVAIQAIAFDKTVGTNWKVTWHQDLMFPFARTVTAPEFGVPSVKDGVPYARPPRDVLEELLAVRLHLDPCDESNGPLRVVTGSHRRGIMKGAEIQQVVATGPEAVCLANEGDALLMKPLLLHASSPAAAPKHRRVLHLVYHTGRKIPESWYRAV